MFMLAELLTDCSVCIIAAASIDAAPRPWSVVLLLAWPLFLSPLFLLLAGIDFREVTGGGVGS